MSRIHVFLFLCLAGAVFLAGHTLPEGPSPDLQQYRRLPLSIKLMRLRKAGAELFNRRRYEDAKAVYTAMLKLDDKNVLAVFWTKRCQEMLDRERNERAKAALWKKYGALGDKEKVYSNWFWGPEVGAFEVRYSEPKPRVIVPRKVRPKASDKELEEAKKAAAGGDPDALFNLAMLHWSRKESMPAMDAFEKAVQQKPVLLEKDDEGLAASIQEDLDAAIRKNKDTPAQRIIAGRQAILQGELPDAVHHATLAATRDPSTIDEAKKLLESMVTRGTTDFLFKSPDVMAFRQAFINENGEDRLYVHANYNPATPLSMVPLDFNFDPTVVKRLEILGSDTLFVIQDAHATDATRLWIVSRNEEGKSPSRDFKAIFHFDPANLTYLELSNYNVPPDLPDNWSILVGPDAAFQQMFPISQFDETDGGVTTKGFQLRLNTGKGPAFYIKDFRQPLPKSPDVWKLMEKICGTI